MQDLRIGVYEHSTSLLIRKTPKCIEGRVNKDKTETRDTERRTWTDKEEQPRFQIHKAVSMKTTVFSDGALCWLVKLYRGAFSRHDQGQRVNFKQTIRPYIP